MTGWPAPADKVASAHTGHPEPPPRPTGLIWPGRISMRHCYHHSVSPAISRPSKRFANLIRPNSLFCLSAGSLFARQQKCLAPRGTREWSCFVDRQVDQHLLEPAQVGRLRFNWIQFKAAFNWTRRRACRLIERPPDRLPSSEVLF